MVVELLVRRLIYLRFRSRPNRRRLVQPLTNRRVLAASNPAWLAALTIDAPWTRAVANALVLAAGDVDSIGEGAVAVLGKVAAGLAVAALMAKAGK